MSTMSAWILSHEPTLRLGSFLTVLAVMALWEVISERRELRHPRRRRWLGNLTLSVVDALVVRLLYPAAAVGAALYAAERGWGLFHLLEVPTVVAAVVSILLLDLAIYGQHVLFHHVPFLWRLHLVHHADHDVDVTTGIRFHPLEILLSLAIKGLVILALGPPAFAVVIFEIILNATALFNHSNVRLPTRLDAIVRSVLVTPDMHRVHHSVDLAESNRNFGFNVPWWDRLFGTYRAQPRGGHDGMQLGLKAFADQPPAALPGLLAMPVTAPRGSEAETGPTSKDDEAR